MKFQVYRELVTRLHGDPVQKDLECLFYEPPNPDDEAHREINEPMYQQDPGVFASSCRGERSCIARVRLQAALAGATPLWMAWPPARTLAHTTDDAARAAHTAMQTLWVWLVGGQMLMCCAVHQHLFLSPGMRRLEFEIA